MTTHPAFRTVCMALAHIQSRRPVVRPNEGFEEQLAIYEAAKCDMRASDDGAYEQWKVRRDKEFQRKMREWTA